MARSVRALLKESRAAALLTGGMDDYLVQARMSGIRQAATQSDPSGWLGKRLVTNEKDE